MTDVVRHANTRAHVTTRRGSNDLQLRLLRDVAALLRREINPERVESVTWIRTIFSRILYPMETLCFQSSCVHSLLPVLSSP